MLSEEKDGLPPQAKMELVSATVPSAEVDGGVVFYNVNVVSSFSSWVCRKRYSQFEEMWAALTGAMHAGELPKGACMPPKKMKLFSQHLQPGFIEERRVLLGNLLKKLVASKKVSRSKHLVQFLTTSKTGGDVPAGGAGDELGDAPPDAEVTDVCIPGTRQMSDHVLYQIDVSNERKRKTFSKWTVLKRFGQFYEMDKALRAGFADDPAFLETMPPPPERKSKLMRDHTDTRFIEERRALMENYLRKLVRIERVVKDDGFLQFLGVR